VAETACSLAEPGYMPVVVDDTVVAIAPCPIGSYGPDGFQCINCTDGLTTQATASTAPSDCTAPPGYGWYENGVGDDNPITTEDMQALQVNVVRCPQGSWKVRVIVVLHLHSIVLQSCSLGLSRMPSISDLSHAASICP
jgi:hypothetical protein